VATLFDVIYSCCDGTLPCSCYCYGHLTTNSTQLVKCHPLVFIVDHPSMFSSHHVPWCVLISCFICRNSPVSFIVTGFVAMIVVKVWFLAGNSPIVVIFQVNAALQCCCLFSFNRPALPGEFKGCCGVTITGSMPFAVSNQQLKQSKG